MAGQIAATLLLTLLMGRKDPDWLEEVLDPRSTNFSNIRIGDTNINFTGGVSQWITLMARLITGQTIRNGVASNANRADTAIRFVRGKASPVVGMTWSALAGKDFANEDYTVKKALADVTIPLSGEDIVEAFKVNGAAKGMLVTPFIVLGAGKSTYQMDEYKRTTAKFKERLSAFEDAFSGPKMANGKRNAHERDIELARKISSEYKAVRHSKPIMDAMRYTNAIQRQIDKQIAQNKVPSETMTKKLENYKKRVVTLINNANK